MTFYLPRRLFRTLAVEVPGRMMRIIMSCEFEQRSFQHVRMGVMQLSLGTRCPVQMWILAHRAFQDPAGECSAVWSEFGVASVLGRRSDKISCGPFQAVILWYQVWMQSQFKGKQHSGICAAKLKHTMLEVPMGRYSPLAPSSKSALGLFLAPALKFLPKSWDNFLSSWIGNLLFFSWEFLLLSC